jgi:hypothetical protein
MLLLPCEFQAAAISYLVVERPVENSVGTGVGPGIAIDFVAAEIVVKSGTRIGFDFADGPDTELGQDPVVGTVAVWAAGTVVASVVGTVVASVVDTVVVLAAGIVALQTAAGIARRCSYARAGNWRWQSD